MEHAARLETLIITRDPEETQRIGEMIGAHAKPGDILLLVGELGAGKTCLAQGVLWGLGSEEYARSPTFVLVSEYEGRLPMYHMDLYRLDKIEDIIDLGLDEYLFGDGVCVVEWAQKAPEAFPEQHVVIRIEYIDDTTRRLKLTASDARYQEMIESVKSLAGGTFSGN